MMITSVLIVIGWEKFVPSVRCAIDISYDTKSMRVVYRLQTITLMLLPTMERM